MYSALKRGRKEELGFKNVIVSKRRDSLSRAPRAEEYFNTSTHFREENRVLVLEDLNSMGMTISWSFVSSSSQRLEIMKFVNRISEQLNILLLYNRTTDAC